MASIVDIYNCSIPFTDRNQSYRMLTWRNSMSSSKNVGGSVEKNSPEVCLSGSCVLILVLLTSHGLTLGLEARGVGHG